MRTLIRTTSPFEISARHLCCKKNGCTMIFEIKDRAHGHFQCPLPNKRKKKTSCNQCIVGWEAGRDRWNRVKDKCLSLWQNNVRIWKSQRTAPHSIHERRYTLAPESGRGHNIIQCEINGSFGADLWTQTPFALHVIKLKVTTFSPLPHPYQLLFPLLHIQMIWASVSVPELVLAVRWLRFSIHSNEHSYIFICGLTFTLLSPQKVLKLSGIIINFYHKTVITLFTWSATVAFFCLHQPGMGRRRKKEVTRVFYMFVDVALL